MTPALPRLLTLAERYDALLLDAYGVLLDKTRALPGAAALIEHLVAHDIPYFVLTNSASRRPATLAGELQALGVGVTEAHIITSGGLLSPLFRERGLVGKACIVLGPAQSREYVEAAGGLCIDPQPQADPEVVVIADQAGFPLLEWLNDTLSVILRRLDDGQPIELVLCNPDLVYPRAPGLYGLTAGALAALIETVLAERYGATAPTFTRLGKPYPALFAEAARRAGSHRLLMIGDQLATDILGANRFGIDSVLVGSGLARLDGANRDPDGPRPTYTLRSLLD